MEFFGREREIARLREIRERSARAAQFTVVTGRRRIGKTSLVRKALGDGPLLYFFVGRKSEAELCEGFQAEVRDALGDAVLGRTVRFGELFEELMKLSKRKPFSLFLDEFQEFLRVNPAVYGDIQRAWDLHKGESKINLVAGGSVNTLMNRLFKDRKEPLYGRQTAALSVRPFETSVLRRILEEHAPRRAPDDLLALWAFTGGVAKYVELLVDAGALDREAMIGELVREDSFFLAEGRAALVDEFGKDYGTYFSILSAIAQGRTARSEIASALGRDPGGHLARLETDYGLVAPRRPLFAAPGEKNVRYALDDEFFRFWFRFVHRHAYLLEIRGNDRLREIVRRDWPVFSGTALERWHREALAESGRYTRLGGWWDRDGENEIDLVAADDASKTASFFEVKRAARRYSPAALERKRDAFLRATGKFRGWRLSCGLLGLP